ncbi:MAG: ArsC family transcriptional regulator [Oscillospiraceae bacterium]|nr:ArsC family transcriptional regulator [Oscillospiraceae bacterium]
MNIQIFGTKKCFDTKKAERYFKERRVKYQLIDLWEKGMSRGELTSVVRAVKGLDNLLDPDAKDTQTLALVRRLVEADRLDKVLENQQIIKTPVVRNGAQATVGYQPDVWKTWE